MGFKLTWLSIKGKDRATIFRDLRVRPKGEPVTHLFEGVAGCPYAEDAYLVLAIDDKGRHLEADLLRCLSLGARIIVCHVHEGCMHSHAALWADGAEIWRVEHDRDKGARHLDVVGEPPPQLESIRAAQEKAQDAEPPPTRRTRPTGIASGIPPDLARVVARYNQALAAQGNRTADLPPFPLMGVDHISTYRSVFAKH